MILKKRNKINKIQIILTILTLGFISYGFIFVDKFKTNSPIRTNVSAAFFNIKQTDYNGLIPLTEITLPPDIDPNSVKFIYIVQPGDSLSSIAKKFNVSVSTIKTINKLKSDIIRPGQKLIITDEEGIMYEIKQRTTLKQFAKKYGLNLEELKKANYFINDDLVLDKGDEIFIPISEKEAIKKGLIKPQIYIAPVKKRKEIKVPIYSRNYTKYSRRQYKCKKNPYIVSCRYVNRRVVNLFAPGHCTRFVALKKFPFISPHRQSRPWRGNAKEWYRNAARAGFKVGKTPRPNSIVVFRYGGRYYYNYGHVAIVLHVDRQHRKMLIEEMNYIGRFIADKRRVSIDNPKIIGYIYY